MKTAIIGGGAAGMYAAVQIARKKGESVTVFERNDRVLKKIPATGNGRCNLSNKNISIENYYSQNIEMAEKILSAYTFSAEKSFFESIGIMLCEENGRIYPYSRRANAVSDALRLEAESLGVKILCNSFVKEIKPTNSGYTILGSYFDRVIIAAGGCAAPVFGTDGSAFSLLEKLGHKCTPLIPALTALKTKENLKSLKGIRAHCTIEAYNKNTLLRREYGELQFTDYGLSGIAVMQLSRLCRKGTQICVDLIPEINKDELTNMLFERANLLKARKTEDFLVGILHKALAQYILKVSSISPSMSVSSLTKSHILSIANSLKSLKFAVEAPLGWTNAQVTCGGAKLCEFSSSLQSRLHKNLYCIGEALDCVGDCGGYNLHWAWATADIVSKSCVSEESYDKN